MKKGLIALALSVIIGVAVYFLYMKSLQPEYPGNWELTEGDNACFVEVQFSSGPKDYKGTVLIEQLENQENHYIGGYKMEDGVMVVDLLQDHPTPYLSLHHEKKNNMLQLSYEWDEESLQCFYTQKDE